MDVARFHVTSGPASLFERVRQLFAAPRTLKLHGSHLQERATASGAPLELLDPFDPDAWELMTVEARTDTGRFVSTAWRRQTESTTWWVVIGFHDTVRTIFASPPSKLGAGDSIVRGGPLWDLVDRANRELVAGE